MKRMFVFVFFFLLANSLVANSAFETAGKYRGQRIGSIKKSFLNIQTFDRTEMGVLNVQMSFDPVSKKEKRAMPFADPYMLAVSLRPQEYLAIFESDKFLKNVEIVRTSMDTDSLTKMTVLASGSNISGRNILLKILINKKGEDVFLYEASYTVKDNRFIAFSMKKKAMTIWGTWHEFINVGTNNAEIIDHGLDL